MGVVPEGTRKGDAAHETAAGTRVLVVDGHRTNREILLEILASWQIDARAVESAEETISTMAAAVACHVPFGLVILDAQLPDGNGFHLADAIRGHASLGKTPILTLIAADRGQAEQADRARVSACLMKPVKQSELFDAILAALGRGPVEACGDRRGKACDEAELPPLRILVGEDSLVNQRLIHEILTRRGHAVELESNGEEVLARLAKDRFDVVLMDVQMPQMDGFEATRRIRLLQQGQGRHIPVVAMTAHALPDDRDRCLAAGMDDYVAKPIRVRTLMATIASVLGRQTADPVAPPSSPRGEPAPAEIRVVDWNQTLRELEGNTQVLRILIEATLEEAPRLMTAIQTAIDAHDATGLRIAAHTLKGALRYFGDTRAYQEAFDLENLARGIFPPLPTRSTALVRRSPRSFGACRTVCKASSRLTPAA